MIVERDQPKLAVQRSHVIAFQMRRRDLPRTQLVQGRRLGYDVEGKQPILIPDGDRLNKIARRKVAITHSSHARTDNRPEVG